MFGSIIPVYGRRDALRLLSCLEHTKNRVYLDNLITKSMMTVTGQCFSKEAASL